MKAQLKNDKLPICSLLKKKQYKTKNLKRPIEIKGIGLKFLPWTGKCRVSFISFLNGN
jgi:hypothetical protein